MRKTIYTFLVLLSFLTLFTTCKNPGIDYSTFSIAENNIQPGLHNVSVSGKYDFLGEVLSMKLNIGRDQQLANAESHFMNLENQSFTVTIEELNPGTSYYYCYIVEFDNTHKVLTEIGTFTTLSDKPMVRTLEVEVVDSVSFRVKCTVDNDFGMPITERGICWNHTGNPTCDDDTVVCPQNGMGDYYCLITGLELNKFYFVRAYARNEMGLSYANDVLGFKTEDFEMPTVETLPISDLTQTSVLCGGRIVNVGSSPITESGRGIRWGVTPNPDIDGEFFPSNSNEDDFHVSLTNLTSSTTYYYCAYATNNEGTGYGDVIEFTTLAPNKFNITCYPNEGGQATGGGEFEEGDECTVTATPNNHYVFNNWTEGGNVVSTDRDYTFTVNGDRTLVANFTLESFTITATANNNWGTVTGGGTYLYNQYCTLTATPNEGYDFMNWTDNNNTVVSSNNPFSFDVTGNRELVANFKEIPQVPVGGIDGMYSVSDSQKVYFSRGNLQYKAYPFGTWQFATDQWGQIGADNANISPNYDGWIDLFGWGTGTNPTNSSTTNNGYEVFNDWGDNHISNGGSTTRRWRTLTKQEWKHVINERCASTINGFANARYIKATVNNVKGVILFPDEYEHPSGITIQTSCINQPTASFDNNSYSKSQWLIMEANGCVFLPVAGSRYGTNVISPDSNGYYWSSSYSNDNQSYSLHFGDNNLNAEFGSSRSTGQSVRLVYPIE